jgi:magnesium chelatase family protein
VGDVLAHATTFAIDGIEARPVTVEVDIRAGLPAFTVVGLADKAVRESRERVRAALQNSGFDFPMQRITANLAPAHLRKVGPSFDLPLAVAVLAASGQIPSERLEDHAIYGELSLGGELRDVRGALAVAEAARRQGMENLLLPRTRAPEARLVDHITVRGVHTLAEAAAVLRGEEVPESPSLDDLLPPEPAGPDLADVRGQAQAIDAITIAAAGGHNVLLQGPPGTGKTMLARRLPSILPELDGAEAIEVTRIQSVAGLHRTGRLVRRRPFRAPHHTISAPGLVGGGSLPAPGEITLAHRGVLFLDELSEFAPSALEALRQPLEDGRVAIVRRQRTVVFPTRAMLVAATNPCPCGRLGATGGPECQCAPAELLRHRRRLSGPLLDRLDLLVFVSRPTPEDLARPAVTDSATVRAAVLDARERQARRLLGTGCTCNGELDERLARDHVHLTPEAEGALLDAYGKGCLSARGRLRVLRVARTIADLQQRERVAREDLLRALGLRLDEMPRQAEAA